MTIYEDMKQWLREITKDQNLTEIDDITLTRVDGKRRWWRSSVLQPVLQKGSYNSYTGKYVLHGFPVSGMDYDDTDTEDSLTTTCPEGYIREVQLMGASDTDTGFALTLTGVIGGVAFRALLQTGGYVADDWGYLIGADQARTNDGDCDAVIKGPIWLNAGDTLTMTIQGFASPDANFKIILYRDHKVV